MENIMEEIEKLKKRIIELEDKLAKVYDAGLWGIGYVGASNYKERETEARDRVYTAMYGDVK